MSSKKETSGKKKPSLNWQLLLRTTEAAASTASEERKVKKRELPPSACGREKLRADSCKKRKNGEIFNESGERKLSNLPPPTHYVGLDCEMVGVGPSGKQSALARACLVDYQGDVLYDRYVRPKGFVTDFRTKYSGVRSGNLRKGEACTFEECQLEVAKLIKGKVLVGHALKNDLAVLMLSHPRTHIRDTASYRPLMRSRKVGDKEKYRPNALRNLAKERLGITIQDGEHDPGVDARTAMMLYRESRIQWEESLSEVAKKAYSNSTGGVKKQRENRDDGGKKGYLLDTKNVAMKQMKKKTKDDRKSRKVGSVFEFEGSAKLRSIDDVDRIK